jgi:ankyrin repeat protein
MECTWPPDSTPRRKKRKLSDSQMCNTAPTSVAVMSPTLYLSVALKNKGIESRIDHLSVEQAIYFEPYREAQIPTEILRAVRRNDLKELRRFEVEKLSQRNQFGESLMHLVCRLGLNSVAYLIEEAKLPLNVRDKFGRSPLHNACLAPIPNFENAVLLLKYAPKLVVFEDNKGNTPFDNIPARNHGKWSRFLSEKCILKLIQSELIKKESHR